MKTNKVIFAIVFMICFAFSAGLRAQCCNVVTSDGNAVYTSNGSCARTSYAPPCGKTYVALIRNEVWVLIYNAFSDVNFASNSDSLTATSNEALNKIASIIKDEDYILKISGYADSTGTEAYNKELSQKRANAVKRSLVQKGVDKRRVVVASYGEKMPKASNTTPSGRAMNRRVEFDLYY